MSRAWISTSDSLRSDEPIFEGKLSVTDDFICIYDMGADGESPVQVAALDSEGAPDVSAERSLRQAYLFAAAPDLLEALQDLHDACEFWEDQNDPVLAQARQAIAKAKEGEG